MRAFTSLEQSPPDDLKIYEMFYFFNWSMLTRMVMSSGTSPMVMSFVFLTFSFRSLCAPGLSSMMVRHYGSARMVHHSPEAFPIFICFTLLRRVPIQYFKYRIPSLSRKLRPRLWPTIYNSPLANCRLQFLLDRLGKCFQLFISSDSISCHEFASQFGLAFLYTRKTSKTIANIPRRPREWSIE